METDGSVLGVCWESVGSLLGVCWEPKIPVSLRSLSAQDPCQPKIPVRPRSPSTIGGSLGVVMGQLGL